MVNYQLRFVRFTKEYRMNGNQKFRARKSREFLSETGVLENFKKRALIFAASKRSPVLLRFANRICCSDASAVSNLLSGKSDEAEKFFGVLKSMYFMLKAYPEADINRDKYEEKAAELRRMSKIVRGEKRKCSLFVWGSFHSKRRKLSMFSDVDLVLVVDGKGWQDVAVMKNFIKRLFDSEHVNYPESYEIRHLNAQRALQCGAIKCSGLYSLKIMTADAFNECSKQFGFPGLRQVGSLSVMTACDYAGSDIKVKTDGKLRVFVAEGRPIRGFMASFFTTSKMLECNDATLRRRLKSSKLAALRRSCSLTRSYAGTDNKKRFTKLLFKSCHINKEEFSGKERSLLVKNCVSEMRANPSFGLQLRAYCSFVSEISRLNWAKTDLLRFFVGAPMQTKRARAVRVYYRGLTKLAMALDSAYVRAVALDRKSFFANLESCSFVERALIAAATCDIIEKRVPDRRVYYDFVEFCFRELFPREEDAAKAILSKSPQASGLHVALEKAVGLKFLFRRRQPAGLWQHSLMKKVPLSRVDDTNSFHLKANDTDLIARKIALFLEARGLQSKRKTMRIGGYRGIHFFFTYQKAPFEIYIRDKKSDLSEANKTMHSIGQKMRARSS